MGIDICPGFPHTDTQKMNDGVVLMHPLAKLIAVLCTTILVLTYSTAMIQGVIFLVVVAIGLSLRKHVRRVFGKMARYMLVFAIPFFFIQLIWLPGSTPWFTWGPLQVTYEALNYAAAITFRLMTLFLTSAMFMATTEPRDVVLMLTQQLRVPYRFAYAVSLALRFLPILSEETETIRTTHQIRGMKPPRGVREHVQAWKRFSIAIFTNSVRRMQMTASAMDTKGFGAYPERTYWRENPVSIFSYVAMGVYVAATAICLYRF
ncbi:energy-coupling factor transporter transmembrane component T family protein [Paenibacillus sp. GCM10027629]